MGIATVLLSVLVTSRVLVVIKLPVVNYGGYYSINMTKITGKEPREMGGLVRLYRAENRVVLPMKPVTIVKIGGPRYRPGTEHLFLRGETKVNPYYGTGFSVNWTKVESRLRKYRHVILFYFLHSHIELDTVPLSSICTRDCYGRNPWDNQYVH